jgi:peptide/nickel transport system permease protein
MVLWLIVGLSVGILSATRARSVFDRVATVGVLIGLSMPAFVVGELLVGFVFQPLYSHGIHIFNTGYAGISSGIGPFLQHMILPWITLATIQAAVYTRLSRGQLLETLGEDYIRTARAKGLSERRVVFRHAVRAALTPVLSQLASTWDSCWAGSSWWRRCSASAASARCRCRRSIPTTCR